MGAPWTDHPSWELVDDASRAVDRDVAHLLLDADARELKQTRNSQLATFILSMVVLDAVERLGISPAAAAGHSLGEYSALVSVGALSLDDGVRVVAERGEAMQVAAEDQPGTMAAVLGLDDDKCEVACLRADGEVWVANYNAPGQVVIAGSPESVKVASELAKEMGAKKVASLPVGGAFHTPFMAPARSRLRKALADAAFDDCEVPVVANLDNTAHRSAEEWPTLLSAQLCSPVRWRQGMSELGAMGVSLLAELGPGGVLTGLARRALSGVPAVSVATPDDLDKLVEAVAPKAHIAAHAGLHDGEHLYVRERLVVSPANGLFAPCEHSPTDGERVEVGGLLGHVNGSEVRSPFAGTLMGMLAVEGERVMPGEPIAWLRST